MIFQTITGKDQGRVMDENWRGLRAEARVSFGHTFSEGSCDMERIKGEFAIAIRQVCYGMRAYGISASSFSGVIGYNVFSTETTAKITSLVQKVLFQPRLSILSNTTFQ